MNLKKISMIVAGIAATLFPSLTSSASENYINHVILEEKAYQMPLTPLYSDAEINSYDRIINDISTTKDDDGYTLSKICYESERDVNNGYYRFLMSKRYMKLPYYVAKIDEGYYYGIYNKDYDLIRSCMNKEYEEQINAIYDGLSEYLLRADDTQKVIIIENVVAEYFDYDEDKAMSSFAESLKWHTGVCSDFSFLFDALGKKCGLDTVVVFGYYKEQSHAWNEVKLNGKWYIMDCTRTERDGYGLSGYNENYHAYAGY